MNNLTITTKMHFRPGLKGRKILETGEAPPPPPMQTGRVPRVARMMALAIRFEGLIRRGEVADQADIARLGNVSRARVTQIMCLLFLAPEIQEEVLFLPLIVRGNEPIQEYDLRAIASVPDWRKQRRLLREFKTNIGKTGITAAD